MQSRAIRLRVELLDAVKEMGLSLPVPRDLKNMIECSLLWAVWAHSHGRGPDAEISRLSNGYVECEAVVQARRERCEVEYLENLYRLDERA